MQKRIRDITFMTAIVSLALAGNARAGGDQHEKSSSETTSSETTTSEGGAQASKQAPSEIVVIEFEPGQRNLSEDERQKLSDAIENAPEGHRLDSVKVAGWSDKKASASGQLGKSDQDLAKKRISNIEKALRSESDGKLSSIDSVNMARMPEAEMRSAFAKRGTEMSNKEQQSLKEDGGPSKAVVILRFSPVQQ